jgi:dual-specificity kinase
VPVSSEIVLIDFGSATFEHEHHTAVVSTRHYRAPEVILGSGWSYECDVWSLGCILCELLSGEVLFQTHENLEHLALMERMLGPLPPAVVAEARRGKKYFLEGRLLWPINASSDESVSVVEKAVPLERLLGAHPELLSLVRGCLAPVKSERLTAAECLAHPYFQPVLKSGRFLPLVPPALRGKLERQRGGRVVLEASSLLESEGSPLI